MTLTKKDIDTLKKGIIETDLSHNRIYVNDGYLGKIAAILERELDFVKGNDFTIWPNMSPQYITIISFQRYKDQLEIFFNPEELEQLEEPEEEPKNYEPYVIIATLIIFILIIYFI